MASHVGKRKLGQANNHNLARYDDDRPGVRFVRPDISLACPTPYTMWSWPEDKKETTHVGLLSRHFPHSTRLGTYESLPSHLIIAAE